MLLVAGSHIVIEVLILKKYRVKGRLMQGTKRVGFVLTDGNKDFRFTDADVVRIIQQGGISELRACKNGFRFVDERRISDLPVVHISEKKQRASKKTVNIKLFTGDSLKALVQASSIHRLRQRDFVTDVINYCRMPANYCLAISGLRGVGKTTGILQAIADLDDYADCAYVTIDMLADVTCKALYDFLNTRCQNIKFIFIDEATQIINLICQSGFFADELTMAGKKVILTGTNSLSLVDTAHSGLYHRVRVLDVTHISFSEAKRTLNVSLDDYIQVGGLYNEERIESISGLRHYVDTAVVENLMSTVTKNPDAISLLGLDKIKSRDKLRAIIFRVLYMTAMSNTSCISGLNVKRIINWFSLDTGTVKALNTLMCESMFVDESISASEYEVSVVLDALLRIGIVIRVENLAQPREYKYYLTNTSMTTQLVSSIAENLLNRGLIFAEKASATSMLGIILEANVIVHSYLKEAREGRKIYYYRDKFGREVDLLFYDRVNKHVYLQEIKLTDNSDVAVLKARWLRDKDVLDNIKMRLIVNDISDSIIYRGKDMIFDCFNDKLSLYPQKGTSIDTIEQISKGVSLVNIENFLLSK